MLDFGSPTTRTRPIVMETGTFLGAGLEGKTAFLARFERHADDLTVLGPARTMPLAALPLPEAAVELRRRIRESGDPPAPVCPCLISGYSIRKMAAPRMNDAKARRMVQEEWDARPPRGSGPHFMIYGWFPSPGRRADELIAVAVEEAPLKRSTEFAAALQYPWAPLSYSPVVGVALDEECGGGHALLIRCAPIETSINVIILRSRHLGLDAGP